MGFQEDLEAGKVAEEQALEVIKNHYASFNKKVRVWLNPCEGLEGKRRGDIFDSFGIRWEIKLDRLWTKTGNLFVEHLALERSEADFIIYFADEPIMIDKHRLVEFIEKNKETQTYRIVPKGIRKTGGMGQEGTLIPLEVFKQIGKVMNGSEGSEDLKKKI